MFGQKPIKGFPHPRYRLARNAAAVVILVAKYVSNNIHSPKLLIIFNILKNLPICGPQSLNVNKSYLYFKHEDELL